MRLYINDVAVRDGFQIEKDFIPTGTKVSLVNALSRTGLRKIEVTSFVSPKAVPALADANEVLAAIERVPGVTYVALILFAFGYAIQYSLGGSPGAIAGLLLFVAGSALIVRRASTVS